MSQAVGPLTESKDSLLSHPKAFSQQRNSLRYQCSGAAKVANDWAQESLKSYTQQKKSARALKSFYEHTSSIRWLRSQSTAQATKRGALS